MGPKLEALHALEDELAPILAWDSLRQAVAYRLLYALGQRIDGIDARIDQMLEERVKGR